MKNLLRLSCFLSFLLFFSTTVIAQGPPPIPGWTTVPQAFYGTIHIVKFLDAENKPLTGFVADDTGIWYTTNGGTSWTRATITSPNNDQLPPFQTGWVNDITFESDGVHGFAVIDSNYPGGNPTTDAGILITTNGGQSWLFDDATGTPDSGRGIYYNTTNNRLYVSSCDRGLVVSADNGGTWSVLDTGTHYTGFAFNGNGLGVVATEGSRCVTFPVPSTKYFWLNTTDGGMTWVKTDMSTECWQPVGIQTTETFFGSTTNNCSGINNSIMRSDDGGFGFSPVLGYNPSNADTLTQAMAGDACSLFASSFSADGMWFSINDGATWSVIPMSPNPPVNTRFYVSPDTVWSFVGDSLKWFPRPATADIHIWPDTIAFKHAACGTLSDTTIHVFGCNCANSPELTGDSVVHTTGIKDTVKAVFNPPIPPAQPLCASGLSSATSFQLQFQPTSDSPDSANFIIKFLDNGVVVDTTVHMSANGIQASLQIPATTINLSGPACNGDIDTCIEITNQSCDVITLTSATPQEAPQDLAELQLTGACELNALPNGITLQPGESWCFQIDYYPGLKVGTQNASFVINYVDNGVNSTTNSVIVNGNTTTNLKPSFRGFNISAKSCCDVPTDTTIYFANLTCDTIELYNPTITGTSPYEGNFQIDTSGPLGVKFPIKIGPTKHVGLTILIDCPSTPIKAVVDFHYTIIASFASLACQNAVDTNLYETDDLLDTLTLSVQNGITPATLAPANTNFGSINCCDTSEVRTITIKAGCKPDTLTKFAINSPNGNFSLDTAGGSGLPIYLSASQTTTLQVSFNPLCGSNNKKEPSGTITISQTSEGVPSTLVTSLSADTTNEPSASLSTYSMGFDSVRSCAGQSCNTLTITNASCGSITLSLLTPPVNPAFTVSSVTTNTILQGNSTTVSVCLNPSASKVTGAIQDSAIFQASANGESSDVTLVLNAYIEPPVPGYTLTPLASLTTCDSASMTESFSVTDTGSCYTYDIVSIATGNPQVSVTSPLPIHIDSGVSQPFTVTFAPTSVGTFSGAITLTDSDGTTIQVPYNFTDTNCASEVDTFVLNFPTGNSFITPNCTPENLTFTAGSSAGGGTISSVTVTGSPQFTAAPVTNGTPLPYTGTMTYNPNITGNNSAMLTVTVSINGVTYTDSVALTGAAVGVKDSARVGVVGITGGCINPNDTMLDTFAVVLRDPIPDSLGVAQLTLVISYDGNLLFNPDTFDLAPGWHVGSITDETDGIHLTLTYSGNPSGTTPANTTLIEISQLGAISDSLTSTATATNVHFNDSMFEACTMKALSSSGDSASICITDTSCGGRLLYPAMQGNLQPVTNIQVVPNPVHKGSSASTLHFTTNITANVTADVLDVLGHSVVTLTDGALETGDHTLPIPTDQIPEGAYFARINVGGYTVIRQFVLEKE